MSLRLEIVSQQRRALGAHGIKTFGQDGGTIGRSLETDWSLPDQHRFLSSEHASIDYRSGAYYIVDTSKNGVYINDADTPVGRGHPQRLFAGDRIRIGDYEMTVTIEHADDTREVLAGLTHVDPVDVRQRVEAPDPTGYDLIGEEAITGVGIELILEEDAADTLAPLDAPELPPRADDRAAAPARRSAESLDAVTAFCHGAGLKPPVLSAEESEAFMLRLGEVTRELMAGLLASLQLRSRQKAELRQPGTTVQQRDNNALKFSTNAEEALERLLLEQSDFYLPPQAAVRSAFADIEQHQREVISSGRDAGSLAGRARS